MKTENRKATFKEEQESLKRIGAKLKLDKKELHCDLCGESKGKYITLLICEKCIGDTYCETFDEINDNTNWNIAREF